MTRELTGDIEINAPADVVWAILGEQFSQIDKWAGIIKSSYPAPRHETPAGADAGARVCVSQISWAKDVTEKLIMFDPQLKTFTYEAIAGLPGFMRHAQNTWAIHSSGPNSCIVSTKGTLVMHPLIGRLLFPVISKQLQKAGAQLVTDLKNYAEAFHSQTPITPQTP